jgi:dGTPase
VLERRTRSDGTTARGLNLTWEVRDGIGAHSKGLRDLEAGAPPGDGFPATREGQVVRLADRIAYVHHDTDDAVRAGLVAEDDVPREVRAVLGRTRGQWLDVMVHDLIHSSEEGEAVRLSDAVRQALNRLKDFLSDRVYKGPTTAPEVAKAQRLILALYTHYLDHPDELSPEYRELIACGETVARVVGDFLAGMTDRYAIRLAETLFVPRTWAF